MTATEARRANQDAQARLKLALAQAAGDVAHAAVAQRGGTLEAQADAYREAFDAASAELGIGAKQHE